MIQGLKVIVDWETADAVLEAHLLHTYHSLTDDIKRLKSKKKLKEWEKEDIEHFKRVLEGIEIVGAWYIFEFEKKKKK